MSKLHDRIFCSHRPCGLVWPRSQHDEPGCAIRCDKCRRFVRLERAGWREFWPPPTAKRA